MQYIYFAVFIKRRKTIFSSLEEMLYDPGGVKSNVAPQDAVSVCTASQIW